MRSRYLATLATLALAGLVLVGCSIKTPGGKPATRGVDDGGGVATGGACFTPPALVAAPAIAGDAAAEVTVAASADDCFQLTAVESDATGVAPDGGFILRTQDALTPEEVAALLAVSPDMEFEVAALEEAEGRLPGMAVAVAAEALPNAYRITPKAPLTPGQVYQFRMLSAPDGQAVRGWAFQAQQPLAVVQAIPADQSTGVGLDTGIELTFSHDGVADVADKVTISPEVAGDWQVNKRTAVFVPAELAPDTLYTVTVDPSLSVAGSATKMAEPFTLRFETGPGTGGQSETGTLGFARDVWESATAAAPVVAMYGAAPEGGRVDPGPLTFRVLRYDGAEPFAAALAGVTAVPAWAQVARGQYVADTTGLAEVTTFEATPQPVGEANDLLVTFPAPLGAGFYLVETNYGDRPVQTWLQVTDLAPYVAVSGPKTLVWVNDVATQGPVAGAEVTGLPGTTFQATTAADGTALVDTPPGLVREVPTGSYYYARREVTGTLQVADGDRTAVVPLANVLANNSGSPMRGWWGTDADLYWRYLYTDRHLYRPTDTINVWGVARQREGSAGPLDLTVELVDNGTMDLFYRPSVLAKTQVTAGPDGTFLGKLDLVGAAPGYYELRVKDGDRIVASTYAEVKNFVKPAYKIDVVPAQTSLYAGDPVTYTVATRFFEGSPVPNVGLRYDAWTSRPLSGTLTTDANGVATLRFPALNINTTDVAYQPYDVVTVSVTPQLAEEGDISGAGTVRVFRAARDVAATGAAKDGQGTVTGTVYDVDPNQSADAYSGDPATWRAGPAAGETVEAEIVESTWEQILEGQTYDPISKTVQPRYRYEERTATVGSDTATTGDDGQFTLAFPAASDKSYYVKLTVRDDAGRAYITQVPVSGTSRYYAPDQFATLDGPTANRFKVGDDVVVTMRRGSGDLPTGEGNKYLFLQAQNGIRNVTLQDGPEHTASFDDEDIPSVQLQAVRFTGDTYQEAGYGYMALFDSQDRALTVAVSPEKDGYEPGDEAKLEVKVTDRDGKPVRAQVLLSAVDEAIYRLQGGGFYDDLNILNSLYAPVSGGILQTYASHQVPMFSMGAEGGGGGGGRSDFKDTVLFQQVETGADGSATASFELPDNLTSWRVAAVAVTEDLWAGSGGGAVPVSLPAFVDATLNESFLTTDRPVLRLRGYGTGLKDGDEVQFTVESPTLLAEPLTAEGAAFTPVDVALPALTDGAQTLTIQMDSPGGADALERTVTVVPSRLTRGEAQFAEVAEGETFKPADEITGTVQVNLTDAGRGRHVPALTRLAWQVGDRLDQMLARDQARGLLAQYFGQTTGLAATFDVAAYQNEDGGLGLVPFGSSDLALSARVADVAPDRVGRQKLAQYFRGVVDDPDETRERAATALYGLAAVGSPVLPDVQALAAQADLTWREQLYAGLAAATLGDDDTARRLYAALVSESGEQRGDAIRLNVGEDQDDVLEATSLAAVLGARLADGNAPLLYNYLMANATEAILVDLEEVAYLTAALPNLPGTAVEASYSVDGQRETVALKPGESRALSLTAADLDGLDLQAESGALGVTLSYAAPLDVASAQQDPELSLARAYVDKGGPGGIVTIAEGDLVEIQLDYTLGDKAVDGCYQVTDLLPSGLVPVTKPWERGITDPQVAAPFRVDGQKVAFCVTKDGPPSPIRYYARVLGKGAYIAEPAILQSQAAPESLKLSGPLAVEIN